MNKRLPGLEPGRQQLGVCLSDLPIDEDNAHTCRVVFFIFIYL
jgi:hypothetical protein